MPESNEQLTIDGQPRGINPARHLDDANLRDAAWRNRPNQIVDRIVEVYRGNPILAAGALGVSLGVRLDSTSEIITEPIEDDLATRLIRE